MNRAYLGIIMFSICLSTASTHGALRTFKEHEVRRTQPLTGLWSFETAQQGTDTDGLPEKYSRTLFVPFAWEQVPGFENYRGKAWLKTTVHAVEDKALRIVFGGVSHTGTVYVDRVKYGSHYDAFTPWDVVVPGLESGAHELVVEVDNSFGENSALHFDNDYYSYGGITRPVELQLIPPLYIDRLFAKPVRKGDRWELEYRVRLKNWSGNEEAGDLALCINETRLCHEELRVKARGNEEISGSFAVPGVLPWSAENPVLYEIKVSLSRGGREVDDLVDRVGFREVKVEGADILLNGRPIRLRGVNRHEDHPLFGNAIPLEAMIKDLEIIRDLGCNFIRCSHYPNDMRFLDLCDEMGLYVWEESHARAVPFDQPKFLEQITSSTSEMVDWHFNRPSVIIWGCLNECASETPEGKEVYKHVIGLIRSLDSSRPVTFASNRLKRDICLDLVDIVSWNIYTGWYGSDLSSIESVLGGVLDWQHSDGCPGRGKPVIISEFGGGAIYGYRSPTHAKWTEEYQAELHDESLRIYLNHPKISGALIWQFSDIRVSPGFWYGRPRTANNKGIVDEYRRPKLSYDIVKKRMSDARKKWDEWCK
ncbi:MAG: glycoside hydrolase family 2 TIM barrel-domain containing protein [Gemmatimonadota bacterium]|nr:glycoside hydrolase family 2 TIM barrel-domain containing protein [Gemmatimonadota bacterium]